MYSEPKVPYPGPPSARSPRPTGPSQTPQKRAPYYMPPYYPIPTNITGPSMNEVDRLLPTVQLRNRPLALKIAIVFLIIGVVICLGFLMFVFNSSDWNWSPIATIIFILMLLISILGIISMVLLRIPKKIGWYFAMITTIIALPLFPGTFIAIFTLFALMRPSVRYYFHTGQYPPQDAMTMTSAAHNYPPQYSPEPYPTAYTMPNVHPALMHRNKRSVR